jgi:capsular polysaccharide biosynthesis protein
MKKIINIAVIVAAPIFSNAQSGNSQVMDKEVFNICATIFTVGLFMIFILVIIKRVMDYRIKNRIVEKGIPDSIASSVLQTSPRENRNINIKWFALLAGIGIGLTIINYTLPLGIHSLAIMVFCVAASFLGYYFFLKQSEK